MSVLETKVKVDETDVVAHRASATPPSSSSTPSPTRRSWARSSRSRTARSRARRPTTGDQAIDYEVTIRLLNPPKDTSPDFSATAKIITDTRKQVLSHPDHRADRARERGARRTTDTARAPCGKTPNAKEVGKKDVEGVFVVGTDNKVTFRPVKVGIAGEKYFEVVSRSQGRREDRRRHLPGDPRPQGRHACA